MNVPPFPGPNVRSNPIHNQQPQGLCVSCISKHQSSFVAPFRCRSRACVCVFPWHFRTISVRRYLIPSTKYVLPGAWYPAPGTCMLRIPSAKYQVPGTRHLVPGTMVPSAWCPVRGTRCLVPGWYQGTNCTRCPAPGTRQLEPAWCQVPGTR